MILSTFAVLALTFAGAVPAPSPEIVTEAVEYKHGDTTLSGFIIYDSKRAAKRPGVVVVHDWMGVSDFTKGRGEELAKMGYTAMVVDIYGKDVRPKNQDEAGKVASIYKGDRGLLRARVKAGYDLLAQHKTVNPKKIAAMGFCFGGMTALELGRAGVNLAAIVSFHGNLDNPSPTDAKNIKGRVLVLHGADDPWVPAAQVAEFEKEMKAAKKKYQIVAYPGAVHAFTNPFAGDDPSKGAAYNLEADKKSRAAMESFLKKTL